MTYRLVPSSVTGAVLETQFSGPVRPAAFSRQKSAVSADGQETVTLLPEAAIESSGKAGR